MIAKLRAPGAPRVDASWVERQYQEVILPVPQDADGEVPSYAFDEDALIMASDPALLEHVIDTQRGTRQSIATATSFVDAEAGLPDARLMVGFIDMASFVEGVEDALGADMAGEAADDLAALDAIRGVGMSVSAEPTG